MKVRSHWIPAGVVLVTVMLACTTRGEDNETRMWKERALQSLAKIELNHDLPMLVGRINMLCPALLSGPEAADIWKRFEQASADADPQMAEIFRGMREQGPREPLRSDMRPLLAQAHLSLEEFRINPGKASIQNVVSDLVNADAETPLTDAEIAPFLDAFDAMMKRQNDDQAWGAMARSFHTLAYHAAKRGSLERANQHIDRMVEILVAHPIYQDVSRGNTDAPETFSVPVLLVKLQRQDDVAKLAETASDEHARDLWMALSAHLAEAGDMDASLQVVDRHLQSPADAPDAELLKSAIKGEPVPFGTDEAKKLWRSTRARSIFAIASGHARRGDAAAAMRVIGVDQMDAGQQASLRLTLAQSAMEASQAEGAKEIVVSSWKLYKNNPHKNIRVVSDFAMASVNAGLPDQFVKELFAVEANEVLVEPMIALARRNKAAGNDAECRSLLKRAENLAASTPSGQGGPTVNLMKVAAEYHALGEESMVVNITLRAALAAEAMRDPYFFTGAYVPLVDACRKMNRPELIERSYGVLSFPEERAIFAMAVLWSPSRN